MDTAGTSPSHICCGTTLCTNPSLAPCHINSRCKILGWMRISAHLPRDNALAIITDRATDNSTCSRQRAHSQIRWPVKWGCAIVSSSIRDRTDLSFQLILREMSCADRPVWTKETFSQTDSKYKAHRANQSTKCASRGFVERKGSVS